MSNHGPLSPDYDNDWYAKEGDAFWSKSYMDPYSYQPMVTVTVPMYRDGDFYGVSTVDLKHHALEQRVSERTEELRNEIEKRRAEQAIKEVRVERVEKQHAAVVALFRSTHRCSRRISRKRPGSSTRPRPRWSTSRAPASG